MRCTHFRNFYRLNLIKFRQKQFCTFLRHGVQIFYSILFSEAIENWPIIDEVLKLNVVAYFGDHPVDVEFVEWTIKCHIVRYRPHIKVTDLDILTTVTCIIVKH